MKLISFDKLGQAAIGVVIEPKRSHVLDLGALDASLPTDMTALLSLADWQARVTRALASGVNTPLAIADLTCLPVVPRPPKIVCMGLNYADHAKEGGHQRPEYPSFFMRGASSQVGHQQAIMRPAASTKLDYEAELAIVIGSRARHLTAETALVAVAGYACYNDGSVRDFQRKTTQWTIGKNFDLTGGFGPWLVTPDELPVGAHGLRIQSRLNGQVMQDANTADFLFNVVDSLCIISACMTLEPGDVIITGTPGGVGYARNPPVWMAPGDVCEIDIEGIGVLVNGIRDEAARA